MENPIDVVLRNEGGYVDHPYDRGGATKYGVTIKTYSVYLGRPASIQDVKDMTLDTAREIYQRSYYTGPRINTLPNPPQTLILDMAINHGPINGIKMLQRVLNATGIATPMSVDGVIGPTTRAVTEEAQKKMGNVLQNAIVEERIKFYHSIVTRDPSQQKNLKGWLNRADSFKL